MKCRTFFLIAAVGLALAGCQSMSGDKSPPSRVSVLACSGNSCDLKVTVVDCLVKVDPEWLDIRAGQGTRTLRWNLLTSGYKFSDDPLNWAIVIKDPPNRLGQFHDPTHSNTRITLKFKPRTAGQVHTYGVNVVRTENGQPCSTADPWVVE